tara:strand:+ start:7105 stop:7857 length:753 start_codon:yes stop_codon:yes gene_type:complete
MKLYTDKLGIRVLPSLGIGDMVQYCAIPENFYKNYGTKLIDVSNCWIWDENPYIERNIETDNVIDLWSLSWNCDDFLNRSELMNSVLEFPKIYCRSPRLYFNEDPKHMLQNKLCLHSQGISSRTILSKNIIDKIKERYSNYDIVQIGGLDDVDCQVNDARGLDMWQTVEEISTSSIFIGVNSGMMNIANCYPHINKKLIIDLASGQFDENLNRFSPLSKNHNLFEWIDHGWQYYNDTNVDIGVTYTYNKI